MESAKETTSPIGIDRKLHIQEEDFFNDLEQEWDKKYEVWNWGICGKYNSFVESFDTEEEAEDYIFSKTFDYDFLEDDQRHTSYYDAFEEALEDIGESLSCKFDIDIDVAKSYYLHYEKAKKIRQQRQEKWRIENNLRQEKWRIENNLRQEQLKQKSKEEAKTIQIDDEFINDYKNVFINKISGNEKSKHLSIAFQNLLQRINKPKIESDYWQVFRLLTNKIPVK